MAANFPSLCHWHRISHSDPDAVVPEGADKVFLRKSTVLVALTQVTGPELLAPAVVISRHKVKKCIGQGPWGRGEAVILTVFRDSLSALRQEEGTWYPRVANLWEAWCEVPSLLHLGRKDLQSLGSEAGQLQLCSTPASYPHVPLSLETTCP